MSETPTNPEAKKEEVFKSWITPMQVGNRIRYLVAEKVMPPDAATAIHAYFDRRLNKGSDNPDAIKAAQDFRLATGYEAEDFVRFVFKLNNMELYDTEK